MCLMHCQSENINFSVFVSYKLLYCLYLCRFVSLKLQVVSSHHHGFCYILHKVINSFLCADISVITGGVHKQLHEDYTEFKNHLLKFIAVNSKCKPASIEAWLFISLSI